MFSIILKVLLRFIMGRLVNYALNVVEQLRDVDITNEEKRKTAFDKIKEVTKKEGKDMRDSLINLSIELAYNVLKETKGPPKEIDPHTVKQPD